MRKFLVNVQFYGKQYQGFQKNGNKKTIQLEIENALCKLFGQQIAITGCSRTDSGVNAKDYYFTFATDTKLPADRVSYKLNRYLPADIQCQSSMEVNTDYNLRAKICAKTYVYTIYSGEHIQPLLNRFAVHISGNLDIKQMQACANELIGTHNFKSFCNINADTKTFVRTIKDIKIIRDENLIKFYITADGFLYNMVRILVGTLIECGKGKIDVNNLKQLLYCKDRSKNIGKTMSFKGLTLYKVEFDN